MPGRRNPPAKWPLPVTIDPIARRCYVVEVPDEIHHVAAFYGAIANLASATQWQDDPAHTAKRVALVWRDIFYNLKQSDCSVEIPTPVCESEYDMSICEQLRFDPATGKLQALCCGEWTDISGQPGQGVLGPGQPGGGSPVPAPGGNCVTYHALMNGNSQWLAPATVSAGDTVQVSNIMGAWTDGGGLWYCPSGTFFFAGNCTVGARDATDPLPPPANHMGLLTKIAGTYTYVGDGGIFTVPGGVTNALLIFQANDANIADNGGQITFDVTVCNEGVASWCHYFDFTLSNWGFTLLPDPSLDSGVNGLWVAGQGWQVQDYHQTSPEWFRGLGIELASITPFSIIKAELDFDLTLGPFASPSEQAIAVVVEVGSTPTAIIAVANSAASSGAGQSIVGAVSVANVDSIIVALTASTSTPTNTLSGAGFVRGLKISGSGPNPFGSSNC